MILHAARWKRYRQMDLGSLLISFQPDPANWAVLR